jgi:hypothetical protein
VTERPWGLIGVICVLGAGLLGAVVLYATKPAEAAPVPVRVTVTAPTQDAPSATPTRPPSRFPKVDIYHIGKGYPDVAIFCDDYGHRVTVLQGADRGVVTNDVNCPVRRQPS